jgi:hypothetical protein
MDGVTRTTGELRLCPAFGFFVISPANFLEQEPGLPMQHATSARLTLVLIARVPSDGVASFQAYEQAALALLNEFGGLLERRLRSSDGTVEVHIVSFDSDQNFQRFRTDPRRASFAHLMEASAAKSELFAMTDVG